MPAVRRRVPNNPKSSARHPEQLDAVSGGGASRRGNTEDLAWFQHWGPCKREKGILGDELVCNIGTHNINSFPDKNEPKIVRMMQTYKDMHVVGMSELNRNWFQVQEKDQSDFLYISA